jgi:PiT family inorganic phosphate transporter
MIILVYKYLMILAACSVSLAHGSNDVSNAISPLLNAFKLYDINKNIAYGIGSSGITLGLLLMGHRVMETLGKKVVKLDYQKGFSA